MPPKFDFVNPLSLPDWDKALASFPAAGIFHSQAWARVMQETYGFAPQYLIAGKINAPEAIIPVMAVHSAITGRRGVSLPFTDYCDPLLPPGMEASAVLEPLKRHAADEQWKHLELRTADTPLPGIPVSEQLARHIMPLHADVKSQFSAASSNHRRNIRKAEKAGVEINMSYDPEAMRSYYRLHCLTRKRHGLPPQPLRFFENIQKHIIAKEQGMVVLASHAGQDLAGAVYLHFGGNAVYKFGASDASFQHLRLNNLLMWRAIAHYVELGLKSFCFGRTNLDNAGLCRFKSGFGAQQSALAYYKFDVASAAFQNGSTETASPGYQLFRHMPTGLSRVVGTFLYKHMA